MPLTAAREFLRRHRNADGSLGYRPGEPGRPEPTLLSAAALGEAPVAWLAANELRWSALLLPAALARVGGAEALVRGALDRVLTLEGEQVPNDAETAGYNTEVVAWPWVPHTAPWVEPTAYALLSLRRTGNSAHPRFSAGQAMILDRQCDDGGWNYGNPEVLGARLESDLPPTAWAVMAIPAGEAATRGLERLRDAARVPSTLTRALAILGRAAHGQDEAGILTGLLERQQADGGFGGRCDWTALAACALAVLEGEAHPFAEDP